MIFLSVFEFALSILNCSRYGRWIARELAVCIALLAGSAALAQPATAPTVRPLDGRAPVISAVNAANRTPGTTLRVMRGAEVLRTLTTTIPVKLPKSVLDGTGNSAGLKLDADAQKFVIDPDRGEWYALIEIRDGYSVIYEGDNRLLAQAEGCRARSERDVVLGSTDNLPGTVTDRIGGLKKEILVVADCVPYRGVLECDRGGDDCEQKYKSTLSKAAMAALVTLRQLDIPEDIAPRALLAAASGPALPATRSAQSASADGFRYHEPGMTLIRQYGAPANCDLVVGKQFVLDRKTQYSRLVFAGPGLMKRFPISLPADKLAYANSQIFGPGGGFFVTEEGKGKPREDISCKTLQYDDSMGVFGDEDKFDDRNFHPPWADTFCEWRSNAYTQPFCAAPGQAAMKGPHFGVDLRAWNTDMSADVPIVSVSDGVVVEVARKRHGAGAYWEGFVVKVRSQHLVFVYRHMNPDKSPFKAGAPDRIVLGDRVSAGQILGIMGKFYDTPNGTTKHLHFEIEAPVPKSVLLGPACLFKYRDGTGKRVRVRVCTAREKAPAFPTLVASYLGERYGETVPLDKIDRETGLPSLPALQYEIRPAGRAPR